jgi:hypothetical protein
LKSNGNSGLPGLDIDAIVEGRDGRSGGDEVEDKDEVGGNGGASPIDDDVAVAELAPASSHGFGGDGILRY